MILEMRRTPQPAQDLPDDDGEMHTGPMGDCMTILVLWNYDFERQIFRNIRGYHGSGGFNAINLNSLFAGVPNTGETAIYGLFGSVSQDSNDPKKFAQLIKQYFPDATTSTYVVPEDAYVERNGALRYR